MVAKDPLYVRRSMERYSHRFGFDEGILFSALIKYDQVRSHIKERNDALVLGLLHLVCFEENITGPGVESLKDTALKMGISLDSTYHSLSANLHFAHAKTVAYPTANAFREYLRT